MTEKLLTGTYSIKTKNLTLTWFLFVGKTRWASQIMGVIIVEVGGEGHQATASPETGSVCERM